MGNNKDISKQAVAIMEVLEDKLNSKQKKNIITKAKNLNKDIKDHAILVAAGAFCIGYVMGKLRK